MTTEIFAGAGLVVHDEEEDGAFGKVLVCGDFPFVA